MGKRGVVVFAVIVLFVLIAACGTEKPNQLDEARKGKYGLLVQKIELGGTMPVIVGLAGAWQNDATLAVEEQQKQRNQIAAIQTRILNEMQNFKTENIDKFQPIPFIGMTVDIDGLVYLANSPLVSSIEEDFTVATTSKQ